MVDVKKEWHVNNNESLGYTWSAQAEFGIVEIEEEVLFNRIEFLHLADRDYKGAYAMELGWRYNVDNLKWYRLKGF